MINRISGSSSWTMSAQHNSQQELAPYLKKAEDELSPNIVGMLIKKRGTSELVRAVWKHVTRIFELIYCCQSSGRGMSARRTFGPGDKF